MTLGSKGTRETIGLPGTGISYTEYDKNDVPETGERNQKQYNSPCLILLVLAGVIFLIGTIISAVNK